MTPSDRYLRDPLFHALVKSMLAHLQNASLTGTELREAAILAAQIHEVNNIRPVMRFGFPGKSDP